MSLTVHRFQLPLSFFATLFGMNAQELNEGKMPLNMQLMYMCKKPFVHDHGAMMSG